MKRSQHAHRVDQSKGPKARPVVLSVFQMLFSNCRLVFTCFSRIVSLFATSSISVSGSHDEQKEPLINKTSRHYFFLIFSLFLSEDNLPSDRCFWKAVPVLHILSVRPFCLCCWSCVFIGIIRFLSPVWVLFLQLSADKDWRLQKEIFMSLKGLKVCRKNTTRIPNQWDGAPQWVL